MKEKEESEKVSLMLSIQKTKIIASSLITSWQIDGKTVETAADFIFQGSEITADGDWSHEIKRCLRLGRKVITKLDSILKSWDIALPTKIRLVKAMVFPCHVWMWKMDYKESWQPKIWCFWIVVLKKMLEGRLEYKRTQPLHPKGNQVWIYIGKTNIEPETPIRWPLNAKSWLIWKLLWFACECGHRAWGASATESWPPRKRIAAVWHSACRRLGKPFLGGRTGIHRECVFRSLFAASVLLLRRQTCRPALRASIPRVRAVCLPAHSEPWKHIPGSERCCPWGRRLQKCVWGGQVQCWGHLVKGALHIHWAPGEQLWTRPLLGISQSKEQC